MDLKELYSSAPNNSAYVDIVAVHGLGEEQTKAWTHPGSGTLWLRDLLPATALCARVLSFGYNADTPSFLGGGSSNRILQHAVNLVAELHANRSLVNAVERPIVFVCHGLGGILVKKALAHAFSRTSNKVDHLYSIFVSTYGILFLGTPHHGIENTSWQLMVQNPSGDAGIPTELQAAIAKDSETLQNITDEFAPLAKRFHLYFFWEGFQTSYGSINGFVVNEDSAAPIWDNTERSCIYATHSEMCKFESTESPGYKVVLAAMLRYAQEAPDMVEKRWLEAGKILAKQRLNEAAELTGVDRLIGERSCQDQPENKVLRNRHFRIPHSVSSIFTGRKDFTQKLREKIMSSTDPDAPCKQKRFVCYGLGGSGKTQFCLNFVEDNRDSFWGIFWVDASSVENAERALSEIGQLGGMGDTCIAGRYWLTGLEMPWLLVIDNADDPSVDYARFFPAGDRGHILVTSRNPDCRIHATIGYYEFKEMDPEDAITLLLKAAQIGGVEDKKNRELARPMAKALGHLPLALIQAGASIRQNICSLEDYLEIYSSRRSQIISDQPVQGGDHYKYTIYTTWEVSFQMIQNQSSELAKDAIDILQIFAFLHFEQIPTAIFEKAWHGVQLLDLSQPVSSFVEKCLGTFRNNWVFANLYNRPLPTNVTSSRSNLPPIVGHHGMKFDRYRFRNALAMLASFSLIFKDSAKDSYSMHPMVHFWARDRLLLDDRSMWSEVATNILALSILPTSEGGAKVVGADQHYRRSLLPHIDSCLHEHTKPFLGHIVATGQILKAVKFATAYSEGGRWANASELQEQVVKARTMRLGREHIETIQAMADLAQMYWNLSRLDKALKLQLEIVDLCSKNLGHEDPMTLRAMDSLGSTYWICGRTMDAEKVGARAMDGMNRVLPKNHPDRISAMHNYGRTLMHRGKFKGALEIQTEAFRLRAKKLGPEHLDTLMVMADLGMTFHALGQLNEAERLLINVLEARKRILGQEHAYTLWAINDLSKIYLSQGHAKKAEDMIFRILEVVERTLGKDHIGMMMTMHNLARAYGGQDRWAKAKLILIDLIELQTRKLGPRHPDTINAIAELARACGHLKQRDEAEKFYLQAIEAMKKVMGMDHPRTLASVGQLVVIYKTQGRIREAEELETEFPALVPVSPLIGSSRKNSRRWIFPSQKNTLDTEDQKDKAGKKKGGIIARKTV